MTPAPFLDDIAEGPAGGRAHWLTASDGVRIRMGDWPRADGTAAKGTVFMFPGRTEFIEKYGPDAHGFTAAGYAFLAIDWRGQGLADRAYPDQPNLGHVDHYDEFQLDTDAVIAAAEALDLPKPWYVIGHSMGGCIGLRALNRGLPFNASVFSAPMWGIGMSPAMRPVAWGLSGLSRITGTSGRFAPGRDRESYVVIAPFEDNMLTRDAEMFAFMKRQLAAYPELALAGPSLGWIWASLTEIRREVTKPAPDVPMICFLGERERIVDTAAVRKRAESWPKGRLEVVPGAEHEIPQELPEVRARFVEESIALFAAHP